ncbi:hypothetical protein ACQ4PT_036960 [Festuca glaucescens]
MDGEENTGAGGSDELHPAGSKGSGDHGQPSSARPISSPTSRIAVQKIHQVISNLSDYKKFLVDEMGFWGGGGVVLLFPHIPKLNLKFSKWIMSVVEIDSHSIVLGKSKQTIRFYPEDFHKVFGLPCGERNINGINGADGAITPDGVEFIRCCIGLSDKSAHSLKVAESFLHKDISECSSRLEKDCFQMSFVIFVMGHFFAPSTKHDYTSVDYWGAIRDTDNIERFSWCQYAFDALIEGIAKLQAEIKTGGQVHNLSGCHPFLQAGTPIGCALKQHNAKGVYLVNQLKNYIVEENIRFTKKMLEGCGGRCQCCALWADSRCVKVAAKEYNPLEVTPAPGPAGILTNIAGKRLDMSSCKDPPPFDLDSDQEKEVTSLLG